MASISTGYYVYRLRIIEDASTTSLFFATIGLAHDEYQEQMDRGTSPHNMQINPQWVRSK